MDPSSSCPDGDQNFEFAFNSSTFSDRVLQIEIRRMSRRGRRGRIGRGGRTEERRGAVGVGRMRNVGVFESGNIGPAEVDLGDAVLINDRPDLEDGEVYEINDEIMIEGSGDEAEEAAEVVGDSESSTTMRLFSNGMRESDQRHATYASGEPPAAPCTMAENRTLSGVTENFGPLTARISFSIRNGAASDVRSLLVRANIPKAYHWPTIHGIAPRSSIPNARLFVRCAAAQIAMHPPTGMTDAMKKKVAIILGVSRAVMTEIYELTETDLIPDECVPGMLTVAPAVEGVREQTMTISTEVTGAGLTAIRAVVDLTDADLAAIASIHMSSIGLPPLQGYSLFTCQHHYLSDVKTQSRKAFDVVERAYWVASGVKDWWSTDQDLCRDALWHKAAHPILLSLKRRWAMDRKIKDYLVGADCGPAASRLPFVESQVRAAGSAVVLLDTIKPIVTAFDGLLEYKALIDAMDTVAAFDPLAPDDPIADRTVLPPGTPAAVTSRNTALSALSWILERNSNTLAWCFGFYEALANANPTLSNAEGGAD